jgi:hypothetical protein
MTRDDLNLGRAGGPRRPSALWPESLPRGLFISELLAKGLSYVVHDDFRGVVSPARVAELGHPILMRADPVGEQVEAFVRLARGQIVLIDTDHKQVAIEVAADRHELAAAALSRLRHELATEPSTPDRVSVAFWMSGQCSGDVRHRDIEAPSFAAIAANYARPVRGALERLMALRAPDRGRLILWRGEPGTGKSHALRALAHEWAPWCSAHFIMDPEALLGRGGAYMLDVLTWEGDGDPDRWRLLILEDAGELIAADARAVAGQALSRLLNVADGLLGQGTRTLVLITTNEPVGRLHPATRRPGRCLADMEFAPLSVDEANAWLAARGYDRRVSQPSTLAELYGQIDGDRAESADMLTERFGFARALAEPAHVS